MADTALGPWADVVGQEAATAFLRETLKRGRWCHAYLFAGPEGVGKTMAARIFAQALLCQGGAQTGVPCGGCLSCRRFAQGTHPDFLELSPGGKTIGIDAVRALQRGLAMRPGLSPRRVAVIEPAEAMTEVAQNALLKTLEEPPGASILLLVAHVAAGLLPTIVSRCQRVRFSTVPPAELKALVEEKRPEYQGAGGLIAALAEGRPGIALGRDWQGVLARREQLAAIAGQWPTTDPLPALQLAAEWEHLPEEAQMLELDLLQLWVRDLLVLQEHPGAPGGLLVHADRVEALRQQVGKWPPGRLLQVQEAFFRARDRMRRHVNRRLNFDVLLLQVSQPGPLPSQTW